MTHGFSIKIFGRSYLLAVLMPEEVPDFCEFRRKISGHEQVLGKDGWDSPTNTKPKQVLRDAHKSPTYFTYILDENVGPGATYYFRTNTSGVYSAWKELGDAGHTRLPAPKNIRASVRHGHS